MDGWMMSPNRLTDGIGGLGIRGCQVDPANSSCMNLASYHNHRILFLLSLDFAFQLAIFLSSWVDRVDSRKDSKLANLIRVLLSYRAIILQEKTPKSTFRSYIQVVMCSGPAGI